MATKKATKPSTTRKSSKPKATSNWFTDAMSEANIGVVRAHQGNKGHKK